MVNYSDEGADDGGKRVMLVLFVGGVSYLEIAALRYLSKEPSFPFTILTASTSVISGSSFLNSIQLDLDALQTTPIAPTTGEHSSGR